MKAKDRRLAEIRKAITEITPSEALELQTEGGALIDVRDQGEVAQGSPKNAYRLGRSFLELNVEESIPDMSTPLMVMCAGGLRSLFAADALKSLGYSSVYSVSGGFNRWKNEGIPFEVPQNLSAEERDRYARHLLLKEVGEEGQLKLKNSRVLLIGAGGLGSPSALYLAAAGIGTLGIVDHDVVDRSNLQRQIIHTEESVGIPKVDSAKVALQALNSNVNVITYQENINEDNVDEIFSQYDVIVDGTDNIPARYLISDAAVKHGLPNVHAAVFRFEGQITCFYPAANKGGGCYRCMFPVAPDASLAPSCSEAGVLGVMPGLFGLLQAIEVIKMILDIGEPLMGKMLHYDVLRCEMMMFKHKARPGCPYCSEGAVHPGYNVIAEVCAAP